MNRIDIPAHICRGVVTPRVVEPYSCERLSASLQRDRWCGPAAVSALTGRSREAAAAWINEHRKRPHYRSVQGTRFGELIYTLGVFGWSYIPLGAIRKVRLSAFAEATEHRPDLAFLVGLSKHWVAVQNGTVFDNQERVKRFAESKWKRYSVFTVGYIYATAGFDAVRNQLYDPVPYVVQLKGGKRVFGNEL